MHSNGWPILPWEPPWVQRARASRGERFDERRCVEIVLETYREIARRKQLAVS